MYNQILIHSSENLFLFLCSFSDMAMYTAMCIFWFSTYLACLYRKVRLKSQKCYFKSPCQTCVNYMGIKFLHACSEILNVSKFGHLKTLETLFSFETGYQTSYFKQQRLVLQRFNC